MTGTAQGGRSVKLYKTVHTWAGITCGFSLFIAFYAGALTMFEEPIARWASPPAIGSVAVSLQDSAILIEKVLARNPGAAEELRVELLGTENVPARVTWHQHPLGANGQPDHSREEYWWATLNADGTVLAKREEPSGLAQFIDDIHRRVGIPGRWGMNFMGVVSLLYGVALVSGVIVLLPSLLKDFFALRVGRNLKRMWLDAHNIVGITGLPFHILMAVTAMAFSFGLLLFSVQGQVIYGDKMRTVAQKFSAQFQPPKPTGEPARGLTPLQLLERLKAVAPDFEPHAMALHNAGDKNATAEFSGTEPGYVMDTTYAEVMLSAVTGEVVNDGLRPSRQDPWWRSTMTLAGLHFGQYGGAVVRWSYFALGIAGAWLFYTGNLLWVETRRKTQRNGGNEVPVQRRDTYWLAAGTVGVCLGCVAALSITIVAAKWLHGRVADLNHWHEVIYYVVFFAAIAWAIVRGAARASVHLLWLCAVATLAIPLTTLAALVFPSLGIWAHGSAATIGVDVTAFVGALCFAWMAVAATRRVRYGPVDSVWSACRAPASQVSQAAAQDV